MPAVIRKNSGDCREGKADGDFAGYHGRGVRREARLDGHDAVSWLIPKAELFLALLLPPLLAMRSAVATASIALLMACNRFGGGAANPKNAFTGPAVLTAALQSAMSDESLGKLAGRKGRLPETRQLGESMEREAAALHADLASLAQRRNLPPPSGLAEKQVALRENLDILPGQVFDRGYSLAMVQDLTATMTTLDGVASHDRELADVGARHKAALAEQLKVANAALKRVGGSPFGFVP